MLFRFSFHVAFRILTSELFNFEQWKRNFHMLCITYCHMLVIKGHNHPLPHVFGGHANLSFDFGPDSIRVILIVHAPTDRDLIQSTACQNFNPILKGPTACCNGFFAGPKCSGDLFASILCLHFRCLPDQTRVHIDSGKLPYVQLTVYHVVHVLLHLINTMVILNLGTSCSCGYLFPPCESSLDYRRDCTSLCSPLLPLSCTWETRTRLGAYPRVQQI